jgi:hypothetical protein
VIRPPYGVGLTLIDYNRSGPFDLDARWIAIRIGPAVRIGRGPTYFGLRAVGSIGWTTWLPGTVLYGKQDSSVGEKRRTVEAGYRGDGVLQVGSRFSLTATYLFRAPLSRPDPRLVQLQGGLTLLLTDRIEVFGQTVHETATLGNHERERIYYSGGLRLIL